MLDTHITEPIVGQIGLNLRVSGWRCRGCDERFESDLLAWVHTETDRFFSLNDALRSMSKRLSTDKPLDPGEPIIVPLNYAK